MHPAQQNTSAQSNHSDMLPEPWYLSRHQRVLQLCLGAMAGLCSGLCQMGLQLLNPTLSAHGTEVHVKWLSLDLYSGTPPWAGQAKQAET